MLSENTRKGLLTELQCQQDFSKAGILLSQPIVNDSRYDFIADIDGTLYRIQCKTAMLVDEKATAISFPTANINWNNGIHKNYKNQIDYFYTCFNNQGYLIPVNECGLRAQTLRFECDKSYKRNDIHWAKDYEFEKVISEMGHTFTEVKQGMLRKKQNFCIDCGIEISPSATRCPKCRSKYVAHSAKAQKPPREELKAMIRTQSFVSIGKKYDISDGMVKRWCDYYNLPRNKKDINKFSEEDWNNI